MFPIILDRQITLNLLTEMQAGELAALIDKNRSYLRQWLLWLDHSQTIKDSANFIRQVNDKWESQSGLTLGIFQCDILVGVINFHDFNWPQKSASMGYWLDADRQGQGIMSTACKSLIELGFVQLNLQTITISCAEGNQKSQAIPKRLGFQAHQTIPDKEWLYDHYVSHIVFKMTRQQWFALQGNSGSATGKTSR